MNGPGLHYTVFKVLSKYCIIIIRPIINIISSSTIIVVDL